MFSLWMRCCEHKGLSRSDHMVGNGDDRRARVREQHDSAESLREHEVSGTRALGVGASQGSCGVVGQQGDWVAPSAKLCGLREASAAERLQNSAEFCTQKLVYRVLHMPAQVLSSAGQVRREVR